MTAPRIGSDRQISDNADTHAGRECIRLDRGQSARGKPLREEVEFDLLGMLLREAENLRTVGTALRLGPAAPTGAGAGIEGAVQRLKAGMFGQCTATLRTEITILATQLCIEPLGAALK